MRVTCCFPDDSTKQAAWVNALGAALPRTHVTGWKPGQVAADYAVVWKPTQQFLDQQQGIKAIFNAGAGVDALAGLRMPPSAALIRIEDAGMAEQMSDYVAHAVLHHYREFDIYADQASRGNWTQRKLRAKRDFPVGILGAGVLSTAVANTLSSLGFSVHAWARTSRAPGEFKHQLYIGSDDLPRFFANTKALVCLLPLTPETKGILNRACFSAMQRGGYIINVARGGHLVFPDFISAIQDGQLAGATLDVFETEPLRPDHEIWRHPSIRITPHISASTSLDLSVRQIAAKIHALNAGETVSGIVSATRGY